MQTLIPSLATADLLDEDIISSEDQSKPIRRTKTSIVELIETVKRLQDVPGLFNFPQRRE